MWRVGNWLEKISKWLDVKEKGDWGFSDNFEFWVEDRNSWNVEIGGIGLGKIKFYSRSLFGFWFSIFVEGYMVKFLCCFFYLEVSLVFFGRFFFLFCSFLGISDWGFDWR